MNPTWEQVDHCAAATGPSASVSMSGRLLVRLHASTAASAYHYEVSEIMPNVAA